MFAVSNYLRNCFRARLQRLRVHTGTSRLVYRSESTSECEVHSMAKVKCCCRRSKLVQGHTQNVCARSATKQTCHLEPQRTELPTWHSTAYLTMPFKPSWEFDSCQRHECQLDRIRDRCRGGRMDTLHALDHHRGAAKCRRTAVADIVSKHPCVPSGPKVQLLE